MRRNFRNFYLIATAMVLFVGTTALAQDDLLGDPPSPMTSTHNRTVADGLQLKVKGIVIKRNADSFTLREQDGTETVVALVDKTNVKTVRKGLFRRDQESGVSYILRGLRLEAEGRGNQQGQLVAAKIR